MTSRPTYETESLVVYLRSLLTPGSDAYEFAGDRRDSQDREVHLMADIYVYWHTHGDEAGRKQRLAKIQGHLAQDCPACEHYWNLCEVAHGHDLRAKGTVASLDRAT